LLIDDLPSELDNAHQMIILQVLKNLSMQTVISSIDMQHPAFSDIAFDKQFHVKHGQVTEVVQ